MADEVWSLVSCCSRKQCGDTLISRVSQDCFPACLTAQLPADGGVRRGEITYLSKERLSCSNKFALSARKIIKGLGAGSNSAIKRGIGVEI